VTVGGGKADKEEGDSKKRRRQSSCRDWGLGVGATGGTIREVLLNRKEIIIVIKFVRKRMGKIDVEKGRVEVSCPTGKTFQEAGLRLLSTPGWRRGTGRVHQKTVKVRNEQEEKWKKLTRSQQPKTARGKLDSVTWKGNLGQRNRLPVSWI